MRPRGGAANVYAVAIIIAVYLPIFTLEDREDRMFRPMAITVCSLLVGSLILALTAVPVLASFALKGRMVEKEEGWFWRLREAYRRSLVKALRARPLVLAVAAVFGCDCCRFGCVHRNGVHAEVG